jgi:hypothetical protein
MSLSFSYNHEDMPPFSFGYVLFCARSRGSEECIAAYQNWIDNHPEILASMNVEKLRELHDELVLDAIQNGTEAAMKIREMSTRFGMNLSNTGHPFIVRAMFESDLPVFCALLSAGADPNKPCFVSYIVRYFERPETQVMQEMLILLLNRGFNINHVDGVGCLTMIHYAAKSANAEIVRILLQRGAHIHKSADDYGGDTALHLAVRSRLASSSQVITLMLLHGKANVRSINAKGQTALQILYDADESQNDEPKIPFSPTERDTNQLNIQLIQEYLMQRSVALYSSRHHRLGERHDCHIGNIEDHLLDVISQMAENPSYRL